MLNEEYRLQELVAQAEPPRFVQMPKLTKIALESFRCFSSRQEASLAPLTFLVGENSTGKTSFLALIRAMWDTVLLAKVPDFTEAPFHLGTFQDIISSNGDDVPRPDACFKAELLFTPEWQDAAEVETVVEFRERVGIPFPTFRKFLSGSTSVALVANENSYSIQCKIGSSEWAFESQQRYPFEETSKLVSIEHLFIDVISNNSSINQGAEMVKPPESDLAELMLFLQAIGSLRLTTREAFAAAPVRSRPKRTYDLGRPTAHPENDNIPTYLARIKSRDERQWPAVERKLESFGRALGLFEQIQVNPQGRGAGNPFQVEVKLDGGNRPSLSRNLIDVGYGVSQILLVLSELARDGADNICLLQQPEIHLHPSAQAELGTLFAEVCSRGRQFIIETHSDYLINRVRMDVRDGRCNIDENDVSILFFESLGGNVKIHSIRIDKMGNVLGAPPSYRRFFTDEINREVQF